MPTQIAVPAHFAAEFLTLVVCFGAAFESLRAQDGGRSGLAMAQALGFAGLGVAQGMHVSLGSANDAAFVLLAIRTVSFVLLAAAARPSIGAGVPLVFAAGSHGTLAIVPAVAAVLVVARGAAEHRRDQDPATFAFAAAFVAFAAAEFATAVAAPGGGNWLGAAHVLRALAGLLLARWLWTSIVRSVRLRFVAAFIAGLVILVMVISTALTVVLARNLERTELDRIAVVAGAELDGVASLKTRAVTAARTIAGTVDPDVARRDGPKLQALAMAALRDLLSDVDFIVIVDARGRTLAAAESVPGKATITRMAKSVYEPIAGSDLVALAIASHRFGVTVDTAGPNLAVVFAAAPVAARANAVDGAVALGYRLDGAYLSRVAKRVAGYAAIVIGGEVARSANAVPGPDGDDVTRAFGRGAFASRLRTTVVEDHSLLRSSVTIGAAPGFASAVPLTRANDNTTVAALVLWRPASAAEKTQRDTNKVLFLVTIFAAAIASGVAWISGGRVTRPILALTRAAQRIRSGDLDARADVEGADEVGALGAAFNDMAGSMDKLTGSLRDAAREEASLRGQMEAIMQSMGDGLIATDPDGRVVAFNHAAEAIIGVAAKRALGKPLADVLRGRGRGGRPVVEMAMNGGGEAEIVRDGGVRIPVALTSAPLQDPAGRPGGRVVVFRDVSREAEAERMKSEFLSNVSHELRTPLTPIKGYTEILKRKQFPRQKALSFLDGILESTARLERIVEILVDFAAMEAGRLRPHIESVDVRRFAGGVVERWKARDGKHTFTMKIEPDVPAMSADPKLLGKAIDELVDNAVKFSPPERGRKPKITVGAEATGRGRERRVVLTVTDEGIGITPEQMPSIFQDFRQLDGSETRAYGGLGLGLAYAKRVVEVHGGQIDVTSKPGRGSRFSLVLAVADGKKGEAAGVPARPSKRRTLKAGKR